MVVGWAGGNGRGKVLEGGSREMPPRICRNIKPQLFGRVEIVESVVESVAFPVFFPPKSGIFGLLQCCTVVERGARERKRNSEKLPPLSLPDHAGEDAA